ncbi:Gp49 family protein [Halodesulfovibrio aestuarii]|uniref:Gp49 family protein n=1 Tax=Halodesulfovibrio aestuarii TaxID=126333 RepID=A0ABV4JNG4_9BACT
MEMQTYIGVKAVEAKPMRLGKFGELLGKQTPLEDDFREGYLVVYPDGYKSWSPKEAFEKAYFGITQADMISVEDVVEFTGAITNSQLDEKTAHVRAEMLNGFVQHETSSCVDPANYDHTVGCDIAYDRIKNNTWKLLGFVLQWARYGLHEQQNNQQVSEAVAHES